MTNIELNKKWSGLLENPVTSSFRSLRISPDCICELYLGVSKEGKRCLILALPDKKLLDFNGIQKENLSIEYFREKNLIILQLNDINFNDLFDDLILSLYHGIKNISQVDEYSNHFIQAFYRWSEFFEDKNSDLLSEDGIKGIMGELLILKLLITSPDRPEINFLLKAWTGLYDKGNDFELELKNLEVKTKSPLGIDVKISVSVRPSTYFLIKKVFLALGQKNETSLHRKSATEICRGLREIFFISKGLLSVKKHIYLPLLSLEEALRARSVSC